MVPGNLDVIAKAHTNTAAVVAAVPSVGVDKLLLERQVFDTNAKVRRISYTLGLHPAKKEHNCETDRQTR